MTRKAVCKIIGQVTQLNRLFLRRELKCSVLLVVASFVGCNGSVDSDTDLNQLSSAPTSTATQVTSTNELVPANPSSSMMNMVPDSNDMVFKDNVETNTEVPEGLDGLVFLDSNGERVALESYLGKKNVVLVFTEGFSGGMLCPFCKTQTSRLIGNYDKFKELDTEILVVYPGSRDHVDEFIEAAQEKSNRELPFPLVLDKDLSVVNYFNIESNLAHPSTFIIDKAGNVRLAYVGADMSADRPSISALLDILKSANAQ